jgi:ABC-2 type transport system permease protein
MGAVGTVFRREMGAYFTTPLAYIFLTIFLAMAGALTFYMGGFFERDQADLNAFFTFHPWLYLVLIPAVAMRLWAEDLRSGAIEVLLTLPITTGQAVLGKFLAAWAFVGLALALTFPMWLTVAYLGRPDHGVILTGYIGSFLMAGGYLAIGAFVSALTRNQVIAFVVSAAICFLLTVAGSPLVLNVFSAWAGDAATGFVASLSFLTHFQDIMKGVLDLRDLVFFLSVIALFLFANWAAVERVKGA